MRPAGRVFETLVNTHRHFGQLHSHHYPDLLGRFRKRSGLRINSEIILKLI